MNVNKSLNNKEKGNLNWNVFFNYNLSNIKRIGSMLSRHEFSIKYQLLVYLIMIRFVCSLQE